MIIDEKYLELESNGNSKKAGKQSGLANEKNGEILRPVILTCNFKKRIMETILTDFSKKVRSDGKSFIEINEVEIEQFINARFSFVDNVYNTNNAIENTIKFNGNINILIDLFYQLKYENLYEGHSLIENKRIEIINFIRKYFLDKEGNSIPKTTIEKVISPSNEDKRPSIGEGKFVLTDYLLS